MGCMAQDQRHQKSSMVQVPVSHRMTGRCLMILVSLRTVSNQDCKRHLQRKDVATIQHLPIALRTRRLRPDLAPNKENRRARSARANGMWKHVCREVHGQREV